MGKQPNCEQKKKVRLKVAVLAEQQNKNGATQSKHLGWVICMFTKLEWIVLIRKAFVWLLKGMLN